MRPCDGTSGLVRGNRRKAVFAFKGLFSEGRLSCFSLSGARFYHAIRKCGEKSETSERNPIFANKTAGRGSLKQGTGQSILVFPALPETVDGSMRQIPESPSTPLFSCKVTSGGSVVAFRCGRHAGILPHTSGWTQINGVNAHGLECHIELPIGNKTNIVSIMLTKGWL